jgi:hypothetical protein
MIIQASRQSIDVAGATLSLTLPPLSVKFTALEGWPKSIECNLAWDGVRLDNEADCTYDLLDEF